MNRIQRTLATIAVMLAVVISGCSSDRGTGDKQDSDRPTATRGEHDRHGGEHGGEGEHDRDGAGHGEEGEESAVELGLNETYDKVRNGARLILAYDAQSNSFNGTVENTTDTVLKQVRVEVHLSNGKELGPTTPADLGPGRRREVRLTATNKDFDGWTAHPEVGIGELGHGEGPGEHDR
ncbi:MAG: FxLYD domain-containing protein, partial [Planctomycetota bacterium]